jgi:uncharacterized protein YdaU (DUF1376 family)
METKPYMPFFVSDYLADTGHLSTIEHGAYMLLIMSYWKSGGSLPDDDGKLSRIARVPAEEWAKIRPTLADFFQVSGGKWSHRRIDDELTIAESRTNMAKEAGRLGGQRSAIARQIRRENEAKGKQPLSDPQATLEQPLSDAQATLKQPSSNPGRVSQAKPKRASTGTGTGTGTGKEEKENCAGHAVAIVPEDAELYQSINAAFLAKNDNRFTNYPKEGQAIKGIITKAKARSLDDPEGFCQAMLEAFWSLKTSGDKFWSGQPFLPSALNSSGIWDRVLESLRANDPADDMAETLRCMADLGVVL